MPIQMVCTFFKNTNKKTVNLYGPHKQAIILANLFLKMLIARLRGKAKLVWKQSVSGKRKIHKAVVLKLWYKKTVVCCAQLKLFVLYPSKVFHTRPYKPVFLYACVCSSVFFSQNVTSLRQVTKALLVFLRAFACPPSFARKVLVFTAYGL